MTDGGPRIVIDWADVHDPTDGPEAIAQHLGAGHDEGPLLVMPAAGSRGSRRAEGRIFADVTAYELHLLRYDDEVRSDRTGTLSAPRWTALVRRHAGDDRAHGLAAIYALKMVLAPSSRRVVHPRRARLRSVQDYQVLNGPFYAPVELQIENIGDGFPAVSETFPLLAPVMTCSPAGVLTPSDEDRWEEEDET